jgi:hypothetical protein
MELHNNRPTADSTSRLDKARKTLDPSREAQVSESAASPEQLEGARISDTIELSPAARLFKGEAPNQVRGTLIDSLKAAYESGNLNTTERIERAAHNLLSGE